MTEVDKLTNGTSEVTEIPRITNVTESEKATKLLAEILAGNIVDVTPQLEFASTLGFAYPSVEKLLNVETEEALAIQESLFNEGILKRDFFIKLLRCPQCKSP